MTQISKDILAYFQIRKTKKQKDSFIEFATEKSAELGYGITTEKGYFGARNIIVGDIHKAKVIYTAHYDTCAVLPFPNLITPKNFLLYLLYQLFIVLLFFVVAFGFGFVFGLIGALIGLDSSIISLIAAIVYWALLIMLIAGPANKHTVNDNTSGVITLFEIMAGLPEEDKNDAAFVFFDLEEQGLFGSMGFAARHKKLMKSKLLVNFDCVSDGENALFVLRKKARSFKPQFEKAFEGNTDISAEVITKGVFYPSDQINFKLGVGVGTFNKTKRLSILYLSRIHTPRDTVLRETNIEFLKNGAIKLLKYF